MVWADHGDDISRQYAGTGALKSGFTRTGKRTTMGLLDDGAKSMTRYYLNTFQDGQKQDALDLASGNYRVESGAPCMLRFQAARRNVAPLHAPRLACAACDQALVRKRCHDEVPYTRPYPLSTRHGLVQARARHSSRSGQH